MLIPYKFLLLTSNKLRLVSTIKHFAQLITYMPTLNPGFVDVSIITSTPVQQI